MSSKFVYENKDVGKIVVEWNETSDENKQKFIEKSLGAFRKLSETEKIIEIKETEQSWRNKYEKNLITICYGYLDDGDFIIGPITITCMPNRNCVRKVVRKILEMRDLERPDLERNDEEELKEEIENVTNSLFSKNYHLCNFAYKYYCQVFTINYGRVYGKSKDVDPFLVEFRDSDIFSDPILNLY